jgi:phage tail sheath gpL-like
MAQNMFAIRYLRAKVTGTWGRAALIDENPNGIQGVATPEAIRQTIVHGYQELSNLNVVENVDEFEEQLIVERNAVDANRVDIYLPADQVNQLRIIAVNYVSHLQYSNA